MTWTQVNRYFIRSDTGYRISKSFGQDELKYCAFTPPSLVEGYAQSALLGCTTTVSEAQQLCERHHE